MLANHHFNRFFIIDAIVGSNGQLAMTQIMGLCIVMGSGKDHGSYDVVTMFCLVSYFNVSFGYFQILICRGLAILSFYFQEVVKTLTCI